MKTCITGTRALMALGVLFCWTGCTTEEGDVTIILPGGGDGGTGVPIGDCVPGTTRATGIGVGQCVLGMSTCAPDGHWGRSVGEGSPRDEICDGVDNDCDGRIDDDVDCRCDDEVEVCDDRRDNNCNGQVDENCACDPGVTEPCVSARPGACTIGTMRCRDDGHSFTECLPVAASALESCDGVDNDCDGVADEEICACSAGSARSCLTGLPGACRSGVQSCDGAGRGFGPCLPTVLESDERCDDGIDNDCDGTADEGCDCTSGATRPCVTTLPGECSAGLQACTDSVWGHCLPDLGASPETCDGLDNDCDGTADEEVCACTPGATRACHSGLFGACDIGTQTCTGDGRGWGTCLSLNVPSAERCDGIDNDCDGTADEDVCSCSAGEIRACATGTPGACSGGSQRCRADGRGFDPCVPLGMSTAEVCDGVDNDCDGIADEEVCACTPLVMRTCRSGEYGACAAGSQTCSGDGRGWGPCEPTGTPSDETCNGIDDDCDGTADEEVCACLPGEIRFCLTGLSGDCADGLQFCRPDGRGFDPCEAWVLPWVASPETCDGVDNDCDGTADEEVCTCPAGDVIPCVSGLPGRCAAGTRTCTADGRMYGECIPTSGAVPETCNGVDDDCDGVADEEVCACTPLSTRACPTGLGGVCAIGEQTCLASGSGWGPCLPTTGPTEDLCGDGLDSDCDAAADEGCICTAGTSRSCTTTLPGACSAGTQTCDAGRTWGSCIPSAAPLAETCNGLDDDCDGLADEDVCVCTTGATAGCLTGLPGACANGTMTCTGGRGFTACLPTTAGSPETCNGLDDDCDGVADEEVCTCTAGATRACDTDIPGICAAGSQTCDSDGRGWGPCLTTAVRSADVCGDGLDSDCDGTADEGCECTAGTSRSCVTALDGVCSSGSQACTGGRWDACIPTATASAEVCDGADNDCDGIADEDVCTCTALSLRACLTGLPGACSAGTQRCDLDGRGYGPCLPTNAPAADVCADGADNDCDGTADEGCDCSPGAVRGCTTGFAGDCGLGTQTCDAGRSWTPCLPAAGPTSELCDGADNDCDGAADEEVCSCAAGSTRGCLTGLFGICAAGAQTCSADGRNYSVCLPSTPPSTEICNGQDDDCDGVSDEEVCSCVAGSTRACETAGLGACHNGVQVCRSDGRGYDPCVASAGPTSETCNGRDDDCDGTADEDVCTCSAGVTRGCITGLDGVCSAGLQTCSADGRGWSACLPSTGPSPDSCADGLDSDCDGTADDGCLCTAGMTRTCLTGQLGACSTGTQTCDTGRSWTPCLSAAAPSAEACNGIDDDCDGLADEDVCVCTAGATAGCLTGLPGACAPGIMTCTSGGRGFTACLPSVASSGESCNGIDDDCDGLADEEVCSCVAGTTEACSTGLSGACGAGTRTCRSDGRGYGSCIGASGPSSEICDGVDNDCDALADEEVCTCTPGVTRGCPTGLPGVCAAGTQRCDADGRGWSPCLSATGPSADTCTDGLDNDCDGTADENCVCAAGATRTCLTGLDGICATGTQTCDASGRDWSPCLSGATLTAETCPGDGLDSDCDGTADEGCACIPGAMEDCLTGLPGRCTMGRMTCRSDGRSFGACLPVLGPTSEVPSNGTDDDCNGVVDDVASCTPASTVACATGLPGECGRGTATCNAAGSGFGPCAPPPAAAEVCDGRDNSCDGTTDEGCACTPGSSLSCSTGMPGVCAAGTTTCLADGSGYGPCSPNTFGGPESAAGCNGRDDDCNGVIDNNITPPCP